MRLFDSSWKEHHPSGYIDKLLIGKQNKTTTQLPVRQHVCASLGPEGFVKAKLKVYWFVYISLAGKFCLAPLFFRTRWNRVKCGQRTSDDALSGADVLDFSWRAAQGTRLFTGMFRTVLGLRSHSCVRLSEQSFSPSQAQEQLKW